MNNKIHVDQQPSKSFIWILTLIFITLKLCNVINWTWWWVLSPLWISFSILLLLAIVASIFDKGD